MRVISMIFLLSGCTTFDQLAANHSGSSGRQLIYLSGADSISVRRSEDLNKYACLNHLTVVCESWGETLECGCGRFVP